MAKHDTDIHKMILESNMVYDGLELDGTGFDETIKLSNLRDVIVKNGSFKGGSEDVVDIVRGYDLEIRDSSLEANGCRSFLTIKGGAQQVVLENLILKGEPKGFLFGLLKWDISIGDHTIYGYSAGVTKVLINRVKHADGRRVRIARLHGEVDWVAGNYKVIKFPKWLVKLLFFYHKIIGHSYMEKK